MLRVWLCAMPKGSRGPLQAGGLKAVVRNLPPTLSSGEFWASIAPYVCAETSTVKSALAQPPVAELLYYDAGKIKAEYVSGGLINLIPVGTAALSRICSSAMRSR